MTKRPSAGSLALVGFIAGFLATLLFHQPALWILKLLGLTTRGPYAMQPVPPLGVPSVISLAFWGGVWGIALLLILTRMKGPPYWITAALVGAIAPTLVAGLVVAPLKGQAVPPDARMSMLVLGLIVNAAWGLGTALFARLLLRSRYASARRT